MSMDAHSAEIIRALAARPNGNVEREDGVDRCACGCKYWENDVCIDCGGTDVCVPCGQCGDDSQPLFTSGLCPDCEPRWAVVASHEGHYDYVLTDGLTEADAREMAEHEGEPFYAKPEDEVYG
jgi:hypothetical protein